MRQIFEGLYALSLHNGSPASQVSSSPPAGGWMASRVCQEIFLVIIRERNRALHATKTIMILSRGLDDDDGSIGGEGQDDDEDDEMANQREE